MTQLITSLNEFQKWRAQINQPVGFVPTMGALHDGHKKLIEQANAENKISVLSIFVNPTQFNDPKDFAKYPQTLDKDFEIAKQVGTTVVFAPQKDEFYPDNYRFRVSENDFSKILCGAHRPGHFDGVLTIVLKLFQVVNPSKAYFGEKDYQQLKLIEDMVRAFFLKITIVPVATIRESDGLAMSSRNTRLSPQERALAPKLYKILKSAKTAAEATELLTQTGFRVDYVEDLYQRRFCAAFLGETRLIDNVELK